MAGDTDKPDFLLEPVEVFMSYTRKDERFQRELVTHLSSLVRQGIISVWHDREITASAEWKQEVDAHMNSAQIILILVSSDFLASDYAYDREMQRALERHERGEARVVPIILRPVNWQDAPFGKLQALPRDGKPVTQWPDRDAAVSGLRHDLHLSDKLLVVKFCTVLS